MKLTSAQKATLELQKKEEELQQYKAALKQSKRHNKLLTAKLQRLQQKKQLFKEQLDEVNKKSQEYRGHPSAGHRPPFLFGLCSHGQY